MIKLGIDLVAKELIDIKNQAIGLITNFSGVDSSLLEDMDVFKRDGFNVVKLFTPEHGLYGDLDGKKIEDYVHPKYRIPMVSLYGDKLEPTMDDLNGIEVLIYDIQDVGLRYYTYIYTMANCMKAASRANIPFIVLDRPNPLGDTVEGNTIKPEYDSFVGAYGLAVRYGMTVGELGQYFVDKLGIKLDYRVVKMEGYKASMLWPQTGQLWNIPSPAIHTFNSILGYNGGCFFEATNISEGRGTAEPFQMYGAPFINLEKFVAEVKNQITNPFVAIRPRAFVPFTSKHAGKVCFGVEFIPTDNSFSFIMDSLVTMKIIKDMYPNNFEMIKYADVLKLSSLTGDETAISYLDSKITIEELTEKWKIEAEDFRERTKKYRLY